MFPATSTSASPIASPPPQTKTLAAAGGRARGPYSLPPSKRRLTKTGRFRKNHRFKDDFQMAMYEVIGYMDSVAARNPQRLVVLSMDKNPIARIAKATRKRDARGNWLDENYSERQTYRALRMAEDGYIVRIRGKDNLRLLLATPGMKLCSPKGRFMAWVVPKHMLDEVRCRLELPEIPMPAEVPNAKTAVSESQQWQFANAKNGSFRNHLKANTTTA